jgi:hypothetical protein
LGKDDDEGGKSDDGEVVVVVAIAAILGEIVWLDAASCCGEMEGDRIVLLLSIVNFSGTTLLP